MCHGLFLPRAEVKTPMGVGTVSILFMFPQHPTESLAHRRYFKKTFAINNIITVMGMIISVHPLAIAQREAGRA